MRKITFEEAEEIWNKAIEAAQDVPGPSKNGDLEAIVQIMYQVDTFVEKVSKEK